MTTANCPNCKKTDFSATTECKACGTRYDDATQARIALDAAKETRAANGNAHLDGASLVRAAPGIVKPKAQQSHGTNSISVILGSIVILYLLHSCTSESETTRASATQQQDESIPQPPAYVSAANLFSAYDANEVSADSRYLGARLIVDGTVQSIDSGITSPVVSMQTANEFMPVRVADLPVADAARLTKGQTITVDCTGGGAIMGSPWLRNCHLR